MGTRLLKQYISKPLINSKEINKRLDAVDELIQNKEKLNLIEETLANFSDISRMSSKISNSTILPKELYNLAISSQYFEKLENTLNGFNSKLLKTDTKKLNHLLDFAKTVKKALNNDSSDEIKEGKLINEGYNAELDFLKAERNKVLDDIEEYRISQIKKTGINNLKIGYDDKSGFYIEVAKHEALCTPKNYFKKEETSKSVHFYTIKLQEFEDKYRSQTHKINAIEYQLYCILKKNASSYIESIRNIASDIAKIDVLVSFALCAIKYNLSRPVFKDSTFLISKGCHPALFDTVEEIIKNDTEFQKDGVMILTGANMSGKSTYLKHNALICLMAQMGCFVPCENAKINIVDKIFFRQGALDDISNSASSFLIEMKDLKYIIDNTTNSSLILLDEPAKSTNPVESANIIKAYTEYMMEHFEVKMIIATHNIELTKLKNQKIKYFYMDTTKHLKQGIANTSQAIDIANIANLPKEIIEKAKSYS